MSNKTKLIIVIVALAVALVACVVTALILGGAFDKDTGNGDPTTDPTSEVADPTGENAGPATQPSQSTDPSESTEPSKSTDPTEPTTGDTKPADKKPGDIKIEIDTSEDDPTMPSGGSSSSDSNAASGGVISFDDLLKATGN